MKNNYPSDYISSPSWQAELRESERQEEEYRRQNGIPSDEDLWYSASFLVMCQHNKFHLPRCTKSSGYM